MGLMARVDRHAWPLERWQTIALIVLQLLFAACASSVLYYRAHGLAPDVIHFGWLSYRAFNIYVSLALVGYFVFGLVNHHRHVVALLALFMVFHLVEGLVIGFWTKAILQLVTLGVLAWSVYQSRTRARRE